ncbi:hypothetical protein QYM36_007607 [Artemia franciscana]|uniref:Pre-mRNA polyadenylation factor Fip1 domain-containing protein n=1 Tax=Artemia franciscana TaxID=6661 RepID=A0AA88LK85_ARTSF|nr:hypothetical protein QYM36_007607 [Artemia franciscana]
MDELLPPGEEIQVAEARLKVGNGEALSDNAENGKVEDVADGLSDLESDEDDVQVTIKALPLAPSAYAPNFMKKGPGPSVEKGKFAPEDFEGPMSINGVPAVDFNLEDLEDKPWRKPGADITDFFNFGFTEETWHAYCERHKRLRAESGVGNLNLPRIFTNFQPSTIVNENSKYNTIGVIKRSAIQSSLPVKTIPTLNPAKIDVIGVTSSSRRSETEILPPGIGEEAVAADKVPDLSIPPPGIGMETKFNPYGSTDYPFYGGYNEPAQISQWSGQEPWRPPPMGVPPPVRMQPPSISSGIRPSADDTEAVTPPPPGADERETSVRSTRPPRSPDDEGDRRRREYRDRARERDKDRDRDRDDKDREKESYRERDKERDRYEIFFPSIIFYILFLYLYLVYISSSKLYRKCGSIPLFGTKMREKI